MSKIVADTVTGSNRSIIPSVMNGFCGVRLPARVVTHNLLARLTRGLCAFSAECPY